MRAREKLNITPTEMLLIVALMLLKGEADHVEAGDQELIELMGYQMKMGNIDFHDPGRSVSLSGFRQMRRLRRSLIAKGLIKAAHIRGEKGSLPFAAHRQRYSLRLLLKLAAPFPEHF